VAEHHLPPGSRTLHGHFSRDLPPVLTVRSGDTIVYQTLDAAWGVIDNPDPFAPPPKFSGRDPKRDPGHALVGPVAVEGAQKGMTLEVRIRTIRPGGWGWSSGGGYDSPWNRRLGLTEPPEFVQRWRLDTDAGLATNQKGQTVKLRPIMGILGMPPDEPGSHSTFPPRFCGGNLDCRELVEGSVLYLPIPVDSGLFSIGDGHAVQGHGEVAGPALECPMERVEVELHLLPNLHLRFPRAETPAGHVTFGVNEDLGEAAWIAVEGMLDLIQDRYGMERKEALSWSGLVVNLRVTQIVNSVLGVHAVLPHGAIGGGS
jgi:acetamidase/formamidase